MPGIDRKPQILSEASELLQTRSFTAFSYQDLSERLGISKASIHHHYATKEELLVAVAERFRDRQRERLRELDAMYDTPATRLEGFLEAMSDTARTGTKICPVGALHSEFNVIPERARAVVKDLFETPKRWLSGLLADGRLRGELSFEGEPQERAVLILAAIQGALQIARAHGVAEFEAVAKQIRSSVVLQGVSVPRDETKFREKT